MGIEYQNIATGYKTRDNEGHCVCIEKETHGYYILSPLQITVSDDEEDEIIGSILQNTGSDENTYSQIIVLPDETARKF